MDKQKLKWIVPGVIVGLGVLWWGGSWYASSKAEERLRTRLAEHDLLDKVRWKSLDASLFGSVTLKGVTVDMQRQGMLHADTLKISDVIDDEKRQRVSLQASGLTQTAGEDGALLNRAVGWPTGRAELPPMEASLKLDARYDDDEGRLELAVRQKDALNLDYRLDVTQIAPLRDLSMLGRGAQGMGGLGAVGGRSMGALSMLGAVSALGRISLKSMEARLEDRGMVERGIVLYKRHNIALQTDGDSVKSQRNKAFEQHMQTWETACRTQGLALLTIDPEQACRATARFLSGDKDTLRLSAEPKKPVSAEQIMGMLFGRSSAAAASLLNAQVKS